MPDDPVPKKAVPELAISLVDPLPAGFEALNPARRLYDRLGFTVADDRGVYVLLERLPS